MSQISRLALIQNVLFHHLLSPRKKPFLASYKLTYRCNLRCQQCPFPNFPGTDLSFHQACQVLEQISQRGSQVLIFEGGEPLLWRDGKHGFNDLVDYARQKFACVGVTTNGTLPLDVDTHVLWVSIDGFEETHNRLRSAHVFDQVIEHVRRSRHPRLYTHITANAENYQEIPDLIRYLSELVKGITLQFYYPYGPDDHLFLPWPERRALLDRVMAIKREGYPVLNSTPSLHALQGNRWKCHSWLVDCANPDGTINQGCYLQGRAKADCRICGFSPYTEISLAFRGNPLAILAGMKIFTTP